MAYFFQDAVTVPQPFESDLDRELERLFGLLSPSEKPPNDSPNNKSAVRVPESEPANEIHRENHQEIINLNQVLEQQAWMYASQGILYYAFPIEIIWGIATGFISLVVLARQRKNSNDSYLIGFTVAALLLLICGSFLKIQDYMPHNNNYQRIYGYIKSANDWLWYTALWLLVVMTLERGLSLIQNRSKMFCSAVQASIIIIMIFCVCLISALPEFWEYEAIETFDYVSNQTMVLSHASEVADSPEYKIMYFWYSVTITVFLPYPILIFMVVVLARSMRRARHSKKRLALSQKNTTGAILNRRIREELHLTRLYIVMILLYILLSGPLTFLVVINGITPHWTWSVDHLYTGLKPIFEFVFYFYFAIQFVLYLTYYDKFRHSFLKICCCCCCCSSCRKHKKRRESGSQTGSLPRQSTSQNFLYDR